MRSGLPARVPRAGGRLAAARLAPARRVAAVNAGKTARYLSRRLGRGGGTTLPGRVASSIDSGLIVELAGQLPNGCAVITGTNGKTTTTRILAGAARAAGLPVITNPEGSNLLSGVATALLARANSGGRMTGPGGAIGIFEVDEGALPGAIQLLQPRLVVITNLFRDQLDRYFEVDFIAQLWKRALRELPESATVVLNADDPQVAHLADNLAAKAVYFGLDDRQWGRPGLEHAADSRRCPQCGKDLLYELSFYAHLGHYACQGCGWRRPDPRFAAWKVELQGVDGSQSQVTTPAGDRLIRLPLAGLYNACNGLAAAAAASCLGVEPDLVQAAAQSACGAFGRLERVSVDGRQAVLVLVKNPSGFNEALRLVLSGSTQQRLLFGLNDNGPDGRDVSWIWDVDFEQCRDRVASLMVCGQRSADLALRLKYAGLGEVVEDLASGGGPAEPAGTGICQAFFAALDRTPPDQTLYVLASYTALWTLRRELVRLGHLSPFWQQAGAEQSVAAR